MASGIIDKMLLNVFDRTLRIEGIAVDYKASIYNITGAKVGILQKGETYTFQHAGNYIVRIETTKEAVAKKIAVF